MKLLWKLYIRLQQVFRIFLFSKLRPYGCWDIPTVILAETHILILVTVRAMYEHKPHHKIRHTPHTTDFDFVFSKKIAFFKNENNRQRSEPQRARRLREFSVQFLSRATCVYVRCTLTTFQKLEPTVWKIWNSEPEKRSSIESCASPWTFKIIVDSFTKRRHKHITQATRLH